MYSNIFTMTNTNRPLGMEGTGDGLRGSCQAV